MVQIHYEKNQFIITCNFIENHVVQNLDGRAFRKKPFAHWKVPVTRKNVEALKIIKGFFTQEAESFLKEYKSRAIEVIDGTFPEGYKFKVPNMPYQTQGLIKCWSRYFNALFMDPGTGKTKMVIDLGTCRHQLGMIDQIVVIGLVSIKTNWEEEIEKFCPIATNVHLLHTTPKGRKDFEKFKSEKGFKWLILGVESLSTGGAFDMVQSFIDKNTMIVMDESSKIKNHKAKRTDVAIQLSLNPNVKFSMILTGTPITQGVEDLYSQFEFLSPDIIGHGSYYSFRNSYCIMGGYENKNIVGYKNIENLLAEVEPYVYQVRKRDVLKDLPPITFTIRRVAMSKEQTEIYKELKNNLKVQIDTDTLSVNNPLTLLLRFSEITGGHISFLKENPNILQRDKKPMVYLRKPLTKSPKLEELLNILEDFPKDEQVIIWVSPKNMDELHLIHKTMSKIYGVENIGLLYGAMNEDERQQVRQDFQAGHLRFIIGNPAVGGIGLNLTAARYMINYSRDFSLETSIQSISRMERIGQFKAMTVYDIVCENTVDEKILESYHMKYDLAETVRSAFNENKKRIFDYI